MTEYRFVPSKCENCGLDLTQAQPEDVDQRGEELSGYCPTCYVAYPVEPKPARAGSGRAASTPEPTAAEAEATEP